MSAELKTSDCSACHNRVATETPAHGFQEYRCAAHGFYVLNRVMNCGSFKRNSVKAPTPTDRR